MSTITPEELAATTLLRFATAGSVDDGKSTLVGRLLHDSKSVLADQLEAVQRASASRGQDEVDLALLTDGLRAEREQGITIDVAYRYFATPRRRFILADTPGHVQYTRNMVTGASTAELTVILVDARNGVVEQTRRHAAIAALLRVPHVVLAVNKMDLVGYEEKVFAAIAGEFTAYATGLGVPEVTAIPISALVGDNVVEPSAHMDWYGGPTVLEHLETVPVGQDLTHAHARLPVQYVIRPRTAEHPDYRGYAGQIAAGAFRVGDEVTVLPSGRTSRISGIDLLGTPVQEAFTPQSVTVLLEDDIDISRGDLIVPTADAPATTQDVEATVCHLADAPLTVGHRVLLKHGTRTVKAIVKDIPSRLTLDDLSSHPNPGQLVANDIGRVRIRTAQPLPLDSYADSRRTGSFILIDPADGTTLTAGMAGESFAAPQRAEAADDEAGWDF
ncbi:MULTISPECIES: sulfate adenylyltransferase subunit 1 [Streptomyces]|uniref:sulfate adenylyltransferase n=1 Tax=Streptomyces thermoviolaceus subsp. thermoviolaceus TaxID=66860 RepID=A0ABX0YLI0_STRTL|nr:MULTISPECIES: GTP-binding protein [Streptomyces]WTD46900.1 GTP-binding protein [Streptomyces thermoviolaceus]NJP13269.1 sulfate adenylyltransferase [Streptomyces thermoviolaceus subsp. thermoviolaceus]RSS09043.1 sulfate adenylyltransferase [Streptomyces sp. WAC00469]GGV71843.1 sulfate adenylyltransferase subunit 1 [Streptomyces thermoviolaceus subsp. apingens]GHA84850.1 sulfate adenylyltransferase subunit 1 [Streptomyces thermoviolaceus subsp. thermoviolaceus]